MASGSVVVGRTKVKSLKERTWISDLSILTESNYLFHRKALIGRFCGTFLMYFYGLHPFFPSRSAHRYREL